MNYLWSNLYKYSEGMRVGMTLFFSFCQAFVVTFMLYMTGAVEMFGSFIALFIITALVYAVTEFRSHIQRKDRGYGDYKGSLFSLPERNFEKDYENLKNLKKDSHEK